MKSSYDKNRVGILVNLIYTLSLHPSRGVPSGSSSRSRSACNSLHTSTVSRKGKMSFVESNKSRGHQHVVHCVVGHRIYIVGMYQVYTWYIYQIYVPLVYRQYIPGIYQVYTNVNPTSKYIPWIYQWYIKYILGIYQVYTLMLVYTWYIPGIYRL